MQSTSKEKNKIETWSEISSELLKSLSDLNEELIQAYSFGNLDEVHKIKAKIELLEDKITSCLMELKYLKEIVEVIPE